MENIDKLFSQRFNEQKPEDNYNSGLWNDFEKELEQEMPTQKSKRKWWMGWKGLTLFNTILVGVVLSVMLYNNDELRIKNGELKKTELLITNYKLQEGSTFEANKEVINSGATSNFEKENVVTNRKLQHVNSKKEKNSISASNNLENVVASTEQTNLYSQQKIENVEKIEPQLNMVNIQEETMSKNKAEILKPIEPLNLETLKPLNLETKSNVQTSKPHGAQYKLKLPDWLNGHSHPRHPRQGPKKEKPDIVPVPVEGF